MLRSYCNTALSIAIFFVDKESRNWPVAVQLVWSDSFHNSLFMRHRYCCHYRVAMILVSWHSWIVSDQLFWRLVFHPVRSDIWWHSFVVGWVWSSHALWSLFSKFLREYSVFYTSADVKLHHEIHCYFLGSFNWFWAYLLLSQSPSVSAVCSEDADIGMRGRILMRGHKGERLGVETRDVIGYQVCWFFIYLGGERVLQAIANISVNGFLPLV